MGEEQQQQSISDGLNPRGVQLPIWMIGIVLTVFTGLGTYGFAAGQYAARFDDMKEKIHELNAHIEHDDEIIVRLDKAQDANEYRLNDYYARIVALEGAHPPRPH